MKAPDPNDRLRKSDANGFRADFDAAHAGDKKREDPKPHADQRRGRQQTNGREARAPNVLPWWRDPESIPKREFLFRRHHIRREIVATIGGGGRCKTTLNVCESISMAVGRYLTTDEPLPRPLRAWVINAEEDQDESGSPIRRHMPALRHKAGRSRRPVVRGIDPRPSLANRDLGPERSHHQR